MIENDFKHHRVVISAALVRAYVANNSLPAEEVPNLIRLLHNTLRSLDDRSRPKPQDIHLPEWRAVRKSVTPDGIVSFIDGKTYKTLKRHLTKHGLDPNGYRQRFGLHSDYPMVAASYSDHRARLAKDIGLGQYRKVQNERIVPPVSRRRRSVQAGKAD